MNLSNLLAYKATLENLDVIRTESNVLQYVEQNNKLLHTTLLNAGLKEKIQNSSNIILDELARMRLSIEYEKKLVEEMIDNFHDEYDKKSDEIYEGSKNDTAEYIFERHKENSLFANKEIWESFKSRLSLYVSWQKAGLEIHPMYGQVTDLIKGCDPLYLCDTGDQMLFYTKQLWHAKYQARLRYYTFNESDDKPLNALPNEQFGFIVSVAYFNYKPIKILKKFLINCYDLLCPGGVIMFTYNNCDLSTGVDNVDHAFATYAPKHIVQMILENIGYEVITSIDESNNCSWFEAQKPGERKSMRGGQTLAEIRSFD